MSDNPDSRIDSIKLLVYYNLDHRWKRYKKTIILPSSAHEIEIKAFYSVRKDFEKTINPLDHHDVPDIDPRKKAK